jgi:hypothetical protein
VRDDELLAERIWSRWVLIKHRRLLKFSNLCSLHQRTRLTTEFGVRRGFYSVAWHLVWCRWSIGFGRNERELLNDKITANEMH